MSDYLGSRSRMEVSMQEVFQNDLLLEHILVNFVRPQGHRTIINPGNEGSSSNNGDVSNCRLVSKQWMLTLKKLFRTEKVPMFHLRLGHDDSLAIMNSEEFQFQGTFNKYAESVAYWEVEELTTSQKYPRFELELSPTFFHVVNESGFKKLFQFLLNYGAHGMIRFILNLTGARFQYIPMNIPQFQFNNLREVILVIDNMALAFIPLMQKMLAGSTCLECLTLKGSPSRMTPTVTCLAPILGPISRKTPYVFHLPKTTKEISLYGTIDTCLCFYKIPMNDLENLTTFNLSPSPCMYSQLGSLLPTIVGKVTSLNFVCFTPCDFQFQRIGHFKFPAMKNLKTLTVNMPWNFDVLGDARHNYEAHFPYLKEIIMVNRDEDLHYCFLNGNKCETLEKLTLVPVVPYIYSGRGYGSIYPKIDSTKLDMILGITVSFSNLTHLEIGVSGYYTAAMRKIFSNLGKLKVLTIYINAGGWFTTNINWDMIFTGLPAMTCKSLMESGKESWGKWKGSKNGRRNTSIRELQDLEALYLVETTYPGHQIYDGRGAPNNPTEEGLFHFEQEDLPITPRELTGLAFYFAFMKMPKLKTLMCTRGFMPSEEIKQWWTKEKGTSIKTLRSPMLHHLLINKFSVFDKTWQC